jgi:RNA polymerase sigma-70 factor (ECF subfamily)
MRAARPWPNVEELVPLYYAALYRYAFRLTGCCSEAEDLTQETFCSAQAKKNQLRDETKVKSWLFSILRNEYLHRQRSRRRSGLIPFEGLEDLGQDENQTDNLPEVEPGRLQECLNRLPEDFRTPLILYYFEELSYRDIADQMQVPIGTVMSRIARAKDYLRKALATKPP